MTLCYHVLHICREVGNVVGNAESHSCRNGTNHGHKPALCRAEAGKVYQISVTELLVLLKIRHERLNLLKQSLAFVVRLSVCIDLRLTRCEVRLTLGVGSLAVGIGCETFVIGDYTVKIGLLVLFKLVDVLLKLSDNVGCLGVLFLVLFDRQSVLYAESGSDETEE